MGNADVPSELGGDVIVQQVVDFRFVVHVNFDGSSHDLTGDALNHVDNPK